MATVAVVGAGAIGGFFGAQAALSGNDVMLCVRRTFDRLVVKSGGATHEIDVPVLTDPGAAAPADWVLLAVKAHQTDGAAKWLEAVCARGTVVVVLQNGVEHEERVRSLVPEGTEILPAVVHCGAESPRPGLVQHYTYGFAYVPRSAAGKSLAAAFTHDPETFRPTDAFVTRAWEKMCSNVAVNPITALTQRRMGVMRRPAVADLGHALMREAVAVAQREGANIEDSYADETIARLQTVPEQAGTSMLYDRMAGRTLEIDAISGVVVRLGEKHGIPTPLNHAMAALVGALDNA